MSGCGRFAAGRRRRSSRWLVLLALAWGGAQASDAMLYYVEDGRVVVTNTPSRPDTRVVPGLSVDRADAGSGAFGAAPLPATPWDAFIRRVSAEHGLSPRLIKAVAWVESGLDPRAVSPKGAQGLMQLMPETARSYGVRDVFDPLQNLRAGTQHLAELLRQFDGDVSLALAAYNAGSGAVRRHGGVPAYRETRDYVRKVRQRLGLAEGRTVRRPAVPPPDPVRLVRSDDGTVLLTN